ncbi:MAG TPA: nucleoside hydrolase [Chloroflexota bacterium]|nr:nucleoside hydrolase [Chloroflexota bacterium]
MMSGPTRVILDTDIGTDVDDCLALGLILASPELRLEGVTCVYGDVDLRAHMVAKLLRLRGVDGVPILRGARTPLLGRRPVYWAGHEGEGLLEPNDAVPTFAEPAADYLIRTILENPGEIHLIAIGPLTNLALAFLREPRLGAALRHLTIMGGALRGPETLGLPIAEHNVKCDPEAAHVVFRSGAPITVVPLDVTTRVQMRRAGAERIRAAGTAYHRAIADQIDRYPPFQARGETNLHDPLAVASVVAPELVGLEPVRLDVELNGEHTTGATLMRAPSESLPANARVALRVDAPAFEEFVVARLAS